jgi:hypothetical protein
MKTSGPALLPHRTGGHRLRNDYFGLLPLLSRPASEAVPMPSELPLVPAVPDGEVLEPMEPEDELPVPVPGEVLLPELTPVLGEVLVEEPVVAGLSVEVPVVAELSVEVPVVGEPVVPVADPLALPGLPACVLSLGVAIVPGDGLPGVVPVAVPVPVPVPVVPGVALEPVVEPVLPDVPAPVCAMAPAAASAAPARIVVAHFPMLINNLLWREGGHAACPGEPVKRTDMNGGDQSRARSYCTGQGTCTPSCRAAVRGQ